METRGLQAFRAQHPRGRNFVVVPEQAVKERKYGELTVTATSLEELPALLD